MESVSELDEQGSSVTIKDEKCCQNSHQRLMEQRKSGDFCDAIFIANSGDNVVKYVSHCKRDSCKLNSFGNFIFFSFNFTEFQFIALFYLLQVISFTPCLQPN